jgi:hypothetical protein
MNKRDRHHQRFVEYLKFFQGQLVTTSLIAVAISLLKNEFAALADRRAALAANGLSSQRR